MQYGFPQTLKKIEWAYNLLFVFSSSFLSIHLFFQFIVHPSYIPLKLIKMILTLGVQKKILNELLPFFRKSSILMDKQLNTVFHKHNFGLDVRKTVSLQPG